MKDTKQTLVWIDLEMTGLDPEKDTILEIAVIVTDNDLCLIKETLSLVIHTDTSVLDHMHPKVMALHKKSQLIDMVCNSNTSIGQAEERVVSFLHKYADKGSPLCGNSVWMDRSFLQRYMPKVVDYLHYRIIDVSSIKELVLRWYPHNPDVFFNKQESHRALMDIRESIAELRHYRKYFFV